MDKIISSDKIYLFLGVFLCVSILVIIAIVLDLWDGVHTAKITKQKIQSHKLRITISKISEYWRFLLIGFLVDCLGALFEFYSLPFVVMFFGVGLITVEVKSMFEHAQRRKSQASKLPDILRAIVDCAHEKDALTLLSSISDQLRSDTKSP